MQCPNCGKEAINVNGKYVCLDCGIEITPAQATPSVPDSPAIINHQPTLTPDPVPVVPEPKVTPTEPETPVRDIFEEDLSKTVPQGSGSYDFDSAPKADEQPVTTPVVSDLNVTPQPSVMVETVGDTQPVQEETAPAPQEVLRPEPTVAPSNEIPKEMTIPDPEKELNIAAPQPQLINPTEESKTSEAQLPPITLPENLNQPLVENPIPGSPASNLNPESYFQPSTIDITQGQAANQVSEPSIGELGSQPATEVPTESPIEPESQPAVGSNLDDLLDKEYSNASYNSSPNVAPPVIQTPAQGMPVDTMAPAGQMIPSPSTPVAETSGMPGTSNLPSPESVFGNNPIPNINSKPTSRINKKLIIIIGAVLGVLLLAVGLIIGIAAFNTPKKSTLELSQEKMFEISDAVAGVMDDSLDAEVKFEQTVDFSQATIAETKADGTTPNLELLKTVIGKSVAQKGFWRVNQKGDVYLDETVGSEVNKKVYKAAEKETNIFSQAANNWTKTSGFLIDYVPVFYSVQNRGSLFYLTKINSIEEKGKEEIEGVVYTKLKLTPKVDLIQNFLSETSSHLITNQYEEVIFDNLEVYAWIDKENKITKVSVAGDVGVKSSLYSGTVNIKSEANYSYKAVEIPKL